MKNKVYTYLFVLMAFISCDKDVVIERNPEGVLTDIFANVEGSGANRLFEPRYSNDTIYFDIPYFYPVDSDFETDLSKIIVRASISSDATISKKFGVPMDLTRPINFSVISGTGLAKDYVISAKRVGETTISDVEIEFNQGGVMQVVDGILVDDEIRFFVEPGLDMSHSIIRFTINRHANASIASGSTIDLNSEQILTITAPGDAKRDYRLVTMEPVRLPYGFGINRQIWSKSWADFGFGGVSVSSTEQSLAISGDYLIIGKTGSTGNSRYMIYNRFTGEYIQDMYMPFTANSGALAETRQVVSDEKGNIIGVNRSLINTAIQIYKYDDPFDNNPELIINAMNNLGTGTAGLRVNVTGDLNGDAVIVTTKSGSKTFLRWEVVNGQVVSQTPTLVTVGVATASSFGNYPEIQYINPSTSSNYLVAFQHGFFHVDGVTNQQIHQISMSTTFFMNALAIGRFNNATYAFLGRYFSTLRNMGLSMYDITNPQMLGTQTSSSQYASFNVFNSERQVSTVDSPGTGDIAVGYSHNGDRMQVYMLHVGHGIIVHEFTVYATN